MKFYTGVGSRDTPVSITKQMTLLGKKLAEKGFVLRSGAAKGADKAFEDGCDLVKGLKHIYRPWPLFERETVPPDEPKVRSFPLPEAFAMAREIHPYWGNMKQGARKLHARNMHQVLGDDLNTPSAFVLYWAEHDNKDEPKGGTRSAVMLGRKHNIPCVNMKDSDWKIQLKEILKTIG